MNIRTSIHRIVLVTMCSYSIMLNCMTGGSAEQGNARISGALNGGEGSDSVLYVQLVAEGFNPFDNGSGIVCSTTTDSAGNYEFIGVPSGAYYLYAFDGGHACALLDGPYTVAGDESDLFATTLRKTSVVTIIDSGPTGDSSARFYIKGTSAANALGGAIANLVKLIGVPAGLHDVMKHDSLLKQTLVYTRNLEIIPGDSITISQGNRPPRIDDVSVQLPETVYVDTAYSLLIHASDPDSDRVVYSVITALQSCAIDSMSGAFSWTPAPSEAWLSGILIQVADPYGAYSVFKWNLTVGGSRVTPLPSLTNVADTIYGYDTILIESGERILETIYDTITIEVIPLSCDSAPLYRFFFNGETITGWTSETEIRYVPDSAGTYEFRVEAWCDTAAALPSDKSEPYTVIVIPALTPPEITGDTLYDVGATATLMFQITSATAIYGVPVLHRIRIYNRSLAGTYDSTSSIGIMSITDTCADTDSCTDTATLYFDTFTSWLAGKTLSITLFRPAEVYTLYIQARTVGGKMSDETAVSSYPR
ncbi:MAG: hypothetical protein JW913_04850 [Chitinispirillaceae bacterium]|nr:hypothetical protein [Chitinispirillaceae bacterium]